jgi:hypothetical protein
VKAGNRYEGHNDGAQRCGYSKKQKRPAGIFQTGVLNLTKLKLFRITADSEVETVVLFMGADPKPGDDIAFA